MSTGNICTGLIQIWLPKRTVLLLLESRALWDSGDELKYEKTGKLPNKRKILRALIDRHIEVRKLG